MAGLMGPEREDFDTQSEYSKANRAFVEGLLKLKPDENAQRSIQETLEAQSEAIKILGKQVVDLNDILMRTDEVHIEDRGTFKVSSADHLKIALAAIMAARGQAVDLPLASGEVIENVRIGELVKIASELFVSDEFEGGDDEPAAG